MTVKELIGKFMPDEIEICNVDTEDGLENRKVKSFSYDFESKTMQITLEDEHENVDALLIALLLGMLH